MANDIGYDSKSALPNKLIQEDGTVTDITGKAVVGAVEAYENKPAMPNKFLNPDGSYSTLNQIIAEMVDTELFIIVDELPTTGENNKIYLLVVDDKLIEYIWVNDKWDPIGMVEFDLSNYYTKAEVTQLIAASLASAKEYADGKLTEAKNYAKNYTDTAISSIKIPQQVFYWNGSTDAAGKALWDKIIQANKDSDVLVKISAKVTSTSSSTSMCMVEKATLYNNAMSNTSTTVYGCIPLFYSGTENNSVTVLSSHGASLYFTFTDTKVATIMTVYSDVAAGRFLRTDTNYSTPYTPQYPGSPATKKYVDDSITTNITNVLNGSY